MWTGHCRRRKIRCLLNPEDPQGKCQNCVRLKKECNFYPVDQAPASDRGTRSGSKVDTPTNDTGTSGSSSPSFAGARSGEQFDQPYHQPQPPSLSASQYHGGAALGGPVGAPIGRGMPSASKTGVLPRLMLIQTHYLPALITHKTTITTVASGRKCCLRIPRFRITRIGDCTVNLCRRIMHNQIRPRLCPPRHFHRFRSLQPTNFRARGSEERSAGHPQTTC